MMKKGRATGPISQQAAWHSQCGAMRDYPSGNSPAFPDSRLVGSVADPPRVTEGVVERERIRRL